MCPDENDRPAVADAQTSPTLADLGEDGVLARILRRIPDAGLAQVGPGDDAAVTDAPGRLVSSADMLVEDEDFRLDWLDPHRLGVKAAAQNIADICAMGAVPTGLLLSIAAPGATPVSVLEGTVDGLVEEAGRAGAVVLGGDLSGAAQLVVAVTAFGQLPHDARPLTRGAARPADVLWLGGRTGWAAAGLDVLLSDAGAPEDAETASAVAAAVESQRAPRPDYAAVARLSEALGGASAGGEGRAALIDLSDGLLSDARRVAHASGAVLSLDGAALDALAAPLLPVARHVLTLGGGRAGEGRPSTGSLTAEDSRALARSWVLTGGEDHGFLAATDQRAYPVGWARIGRVQAGEPEVLVDGGSPDDELGGYRHFGAAHGSERRHRHGGVSGHARG